MYGVQEYKQGTVQRRTPRRFKTFRFLGILTAFSRKQGFWQRKKGVRDYRVIRPWQAGKRALGGQEASEIILSSLN